MDVTRRDFIRISGAAGAGLLLGSLFDLKPIKAYASDNPPVWTMEVTSICCFCACGCGLIVGSTWDGVSPHNPLAEPYIQYVQGDPDHPVNEGALCSKGSATLQTRNVDGAINPNRLTQPLWRAPGATTWTPQTWPQMLVKIGNAIKTSRDASFRDHDTVMTVNRCEGIACLGGAAHDNQECYLLRKLVTGLGIVYVEHQARI